MKPVLITGSSGRIGSAIAQHVSQYWEIQGLDQKPGRWTTRVGNVADPASLDALLPGTDVVIHTAALHAPHVGKLPDRRFRQVNVEGTQCLLDACLRHGVTRLVYTSTTSLYGHAFSDPERAVWVDEDLEPRPRDIYDETKLEAEDLCAQAAGSGLDVASLRMSRCFPEPARLMALYRLYRGVDARDVARAHELAIRAPLDGFRVFNISAQSPFGREDCEALSREPLGVIQRIHPWVPPAFAKRGWAPPHRIDRVYVIDRARDELGYEPTYNFESMFPEDEQRHSCGSRK